MTDKVVKTGIEDVLSSIKRLVSEDSRDAQSAFAPVGSRKPGRLVLTDALRVSETTPDANPKRENPEPGYKAEDSVQPMLLRTSDIIKYAEPAAEQQTKVEPEPDVSGGLSAKIEALEAAIAHTEDQWEPDGDSDDAYSGTTTNTLHWHAEDEFIVSDSSSLSDTASEEQKSETKATFVRDPQAVAAEAPKVDVDQTAPELDNNALRELIAQVVREELQGVLGQRITRNVRKMVRREIFRVLAEQEVE
ncbi:hypothetical protein [Ruegeria profundi]|uniref:Uncharacterized protein n=1 Tax=Ruegeria profundi TaxID=1685378 RepID=A0A0X3U676_9RHOB|nr:hypothetical protein [Ruegeria profundi]KUJ82246.1 hypothetical protein AVO44_03005 [Ruegeria profundi]